MDQSPESLLESFRNPNKLPFEAIKSARSDRARIAPLLIQALQKFANDYQGDDESNCLTMIAIYLLAEWEVPEAFATVLDCFVLNDKYGGFPLGDIVTEDGPVILAALCQADLKALERFAERQDISGWSRGAAFNAMVALVFWGKVSRSEVVTRFAWFFRRKPFRMSDAITWTQLVDAAFELHPAELMDEIRPLFRQRIVDPWMTNLEEFEREAKRDRETSLQRHAKAFLPITDTARSISHWGLWKGSFAPLSAGIAPASSKSERTSVPVVSKANWQKFGRNDPCPCGSGKKYKKCCGHPLPPGPPPRFLL